MDKRRLRGVAPRRPAASAPGRAELLRTAIDHVPGWLALTDAEGRYIVANQKYGETFGIGLADIEGRSYRDVFPEIVPRHGPLIDACRAGKTVPFDDVMHFDPDGIRTEDLEMLRTFSKMMNRLRDIGAT